MTDYVTAAAFDEYIYDDFGTVESGLRLSALKAAERAVNEYTQRTFAVAGASSTRLYVPDGSQVLGIHDCTAVSAVTLNGSAISSTAYQLEPTSAVSWSGFNDPYNAIRMLYSTWFVSVPGKASVSVTATWGWPTVPDDVAEATKILAKDILAQRRTVGNMATVGDFGGTVRLNTYVRQLLNPLRSEHAFGFA